MLRVDTKQHACHTRVPFNFWLVCTISMYFTVVLWHNKILKYDCCSYVTFCWNHRIKQYVHPINYYVHLSIIRICVNRNWAVIQMCYKYIHSLTYWLLTFMDRMACLTFSSELNVYSPINWKFASARSTISFVEIYVHTLTIIKTLKTLAPILLTKLRICE